MKFIKGRWFPLIVAIGIIAVVAFVMELFGWRFTYAPKLENDWDAISAVATWTGTIVAVVSVIASFLAVWFAIQVPKKIAEEQNRIALFEKRHDAYSALLTLEVFAKSLDKKIFQDGAKDENGNIVSTEYKVGLCCVQFAGVFGYLPRVSKDHTDFGNMTQTLSILKRYEVRTKELVFLFHATDEEEKEMRKGLSMIFEPLLCFMTEVSTYDSKTNNTVNDAYRRDFVVALKKFKSKYADRLERELKI